MAESVTTEVVARPQIYIPNEYLNRKMRLRGQERDEASRGRVCFPTAPLQRFNRLTSGQRVDSDRNRVCQGQIARPEAGVFDSDERNDVDFMCNSIITFQHQCFLHGLHFE
ncbi:unnamed protein product [Soboliphyme baturini]|uniref:Uncharacterized protein n=1 Tax=Soboliphyme baturini TaxID=241478 RepID=A0A183I8W2_9BILA|nr:unnamed protein product [Soboliphyme baturini]